MSKILWLELLEAVDKVLESYDPTSGFITYESISELKEKYSNYNEDIKFQINELDDFVQELKGHIEKQGK